MFHVCLADCIVNEFTNGRTMCSHAWSVRSNLVSSRDIFTFSDLSAHERVHSERSRDHLYNNQNENRAVRLNRLIMSKKNGLETAIGKDFASESAQPQNPDIWDVSDIDDIEPQNKVGVKSDKLVQDTRGNGCNESSVMDFGCDVQGANHEHVPNLDHRTVGSKRRRSFCSFHYQTTQGGSCGVEPGDDAALQYQGKISEPLKLLDLSSNDRVSKLDNRRQS